MKKLFINVWISPSLKLRTSEFTADYIDKLFNQPLFEFSRSINRNDAVAVMMMAAVFKLQTDLMLRGLNVDIALSKSKSPNYPQWLLYVDVKDEAEPNINPIIANYISWERVEKQDCIDSSDIFNL